MSTEHYTTVGKLKELLAGLDDDLELWPNAVRNLSICKNGVLAPIGYINLLNNQNRVELY